jgi:hypothetical protein
MADQKLSKELLERVTAVTGKPPKTVIDYILKYGLITTQDLRDR